MSQAANPTGFNMSGLTGYMDKNFWDRTEGKFAMVVLALLGIGAGIGILWYSSLIIAFLASLVFNTMKLVISAIVLFGLGYVIFDPHVRSNLGFGFRSLMRAWTKKIAELTPYSVLEDIVAEMKKSLGRMTDHIKKLRAEIKRLEREMQDNMDRMNDMLAQISAAQKRGKVTEMLKSQGVVAGQLKSSNERYKKLHGKLEVVLRALEQMVELSEAKIFQTEENVRLTIREHTSLQQAELTAREAQKIISGDRIANERFNAAMNSLAEDNARALAEIEDFMIRSETMLSAMDARDDAMMDQAMTMVQEWEQKKESAVFGPGMKTNLLHSAYDESQPYDARQTVAAPKRVSASDLFS